MKQETLREIAPALRRLRTLEAGVVALWREGCTAQSYRSSAELLREVERMAATAAERVLPAVQHRPAAVRRARLLDARLQEVATTAHELPWPDDEGQCTSAHVRALRKLLAVSREWRGWVSDNLRPGRVFARRVVWTLVVVSTVVTLGWSVSPPAVRATASDRLSAEYAAAHAMDGLSATEWLLPDKRTGWLELRFRSSRPLREVRVENSANRHYKDRGTRALRIQAFDGDQLVATARAKLPRPDAEERWATVPLAVQRADRLRFVVESYYGLGAGLAEIELE